VTGGGGSSGTTPLHPLSLFEAVRELAGDGAEVRFEPGVFTGAPYPEGIWESSPFYVYRDGERVGGVDAEFFLGKKPEGDPVHRRHYAKLDLENEAMWDNEGVPWRDFSARFTTCFTPERSGHYSIAAAGDDGFRVYLDDVRIIDLWRDQGTTPGKHEVFLNGGQEYRVRVEYYQSGGGAVIRLGAKAAEMGVSPETLPERALALARASDLVIMAVGFGPTTESESFDRTFELPWGQADLIAQVAAVNDNVAVVLNAGGNVAMDGWIDRVNALLMAWYPGQEGNRAAAEILFGDTSPSGRLPASFERRLEDNPAFAHYHDTDGDLRVFYGEGIFLGYRHWDRVASAPRFPFGFGLSYTTFAYGEVTADRAVIGPGEGLAVSVEVRNTGQRAGAEVVQVYVADPESSLPRPVKELKGFSRVWLEPGEAQTVRVELDARAFMYFDPGRGEWTAEPGRFDILAGHSSADIRGRVSVTLAGAEEP
jgi:beta-glucosidase